MGREAPKEIKMLLIETEKCQWCEFFKEENELHIHRCMKNLVRDEFPYGVFNYYYTDIINCKCQCQFFYEKS